MGDLKDDLASDRELIETHISWVFLGDRTVIKVKKPVSLDFLDFSTLEQRRRACEQEYVLNQRLSSSVYRDVVPITLESDGTHRVAGSGNVVDYAVRMRRLNDEDRADIRLRNGRLTRDDIRRIAIRLTDFHASASQSEYIDTFGSVDCIRQNVVENFQQARDLSTNFISAEQEREIESQQLRFLDRHREVFEKRIEFGRIRDGHGDLRLEHVYLSDNTLNIIDCIEFNQRFRYADVCADLAFLSMDLTHQGRADFSEDLLAAYAQSSSDYDLYALVDFYTSYRAYVRAKISSFLANEKSAGKHARESAAQNARGYYLHALSAQNAPLSSPVLIAVGGLVASGKSYTCERLSRLLHCPVVDTDRTRKFLAGVDFEENVGNSAFAGLYSEEFSAGVYAEVLRRAETVLASRRSVIVDATFRSAAQRDAVQALATRYAAIFRFVECYVPRAVAMHRLREREKGPSISDARADIYDKISRSWEPGMELDTSRWLKLDTSHSDAKNEEQLISWLGI